MTMTDILIAYVKTVSSQFLGGATRPPGWHGIYLVHASHHIDAKHDKEKVYSAPLRPLIYSNPFTCLSVVPCACQPPIVHFSVPPLIFHPIPFQFD